VGEFLHSGSLPQGSEGHGPAYWGACLLGDGSCPAPLGVQLWMEMYEAPSEGEAEMVEEVLKSWFMVGRLGGFNGMNLQVCLVPLLTMAPLVPHHHVSMLPRM
jgi:Protein of unknown function (DUF3531)